MRPTRVETNLDALLNSTAAGQRLPLLLRLHPPPTPQEVQRLCRKQQNQALVSPWAKLTHPIMLLLRQSQEDPKSR